MGCGGRARGPGLTSDLTEDEGRVGSLLRTSVPRSSGPSGYDGHLALGGSVWPGRSCRQAVLTGRTGGGVPGRGLGAGRALLVWVPASGGDPARLTQLETRHCERQTGPPPPTRPSPAAGPRAPTRPAAGGACHRPSQRAREAPPPHSRRPTPVTEGRRVTSGTSGTLRGRPPWGPGRRGRLASPPGCVRAAPWPKRWLELDAMPRSWNAEGWGPQKSHR